MALHIQINKNNIQKIYAGWTHYLTHDNGNRPFCVWISSSQSTHPTVHIYKQCYDNIGEDEPFDYIKFKPVNVFVGVS